MEIPLTKSNKVLPATTAAKIICIETISARVNKIPLILKNKKFFLVLNPYAILIPFMIAALPEVADHIIISMLMVK